MKIRKETSVIFIEIPQMKGKGSTDLEGDTHSLSLSLYQRFSYNVRFAISKGAYACTTYAVDSKI